MAVRTFARLAAEILAEPPSTTSSVRLVAVDGPSGAGKSTFARRLVRALDDAPIVEIDDFLSWDDISDWWPRLEEQVLAPLATDHDAVYQRRDWANDPLGARLGSWRTVAPAPVVIVEGVTSSRRVVADRLSRAVWVEAPTEVRLHRGLVRDGQAMQARWIDWMERETAFFALDGTRGRADVVVDGAPTGDHDPTLEFVSVDRTLPGSLGPRRPPARP